MNTEDQASLIPETQPGALGLLPSIDARDRLHPMLGLVPAEVTPPSYKYWLAGAQLDQGKDGACAGFASEALLLCSPMRQEIPGGGGWVYSEAQKIDGQPEVHIGTTVRAALQVLQANGYVAGYVWAWDHPTVRLFLGTVGPVILGLTWFHSMFTRDRHGYLIVDPESGVSGAHAILCRGYSSAGDLRLRNSWGAWGECWLRRADFELIMDRYYGEAVAPTEITRA